MVSVAGLPTQLAVDQVEDCMRVTMHALIGSNGLYPHFVVVTDPVKRAAVAGFYKQAWDAYADRNGVPHRKDSRPAYREPIQKFTHWDSW